MFWKYNNASSSQIESLLEKEDVGLKEVLQQEDIIQECKSNNKKLIEFLVNTDVLSELISLITLEPPPDLEEKARFRLPHIAAEILSCEISHINEKVSSDPNLLNQLYSFIEQEPPLNPLLSSYFSKAFNQLITRKSEQNWYNYKVTCIHVFEFLKGKDFVRHVLRHIGTSAIPDLVFGLITCVEGADIKQNLLNWLNEKRLVESIIGLLDSEDHPDRDAHDNASRLLVELLKVSREAQDAQDVAASERCDDPLLAVLESPSTVTLILDTMFKHIDITKGEESSSGETSGGGPAEAISSSCHDSAIVNGVTVLLAVLESRKNAASGLNGGNSEDGGGTDSDGGGGGTGGGSGGGSNAADEAVRQQRLLDETVGAILPRLPDFTRLLTSPPFRSPLKTTAGTLEPPLGATRLSVAKLICALLTTNNFEVIKSLKELKTVDVLIDLFFRYSLNNFLHAQVDQCINFVFTWTPAPPLTPSPSPGLAAVAAALDKSSSPSQDEEVAKEADMKESETEKEEEVEAKKEETADGEDKRAVIEGQEAADDQEMKEPEPVKPEAGESSDEPADGGGGGADQTAADDEAKDGGDDDEDDVPINADLEWETTASKLREAEKSAAAADAAERKAKTEPYDNPLLEHLFLECRLLERVLEAWQQNEELETTSKNLRKGYMAHLTKIANVMHHHMENDSSQCHDLITKITERVPESTMTDWKAFINSQLADTNERNTILPPNSGYSANSERLTNDDDDDDQDFREIQFHSESMQQMFSDYQMQQMSDNLVDSFGFNDGEESSTGMKRFLNFNFGLDEVSGSSAGGGGGTDDDGGEKAEGGAGGADGKDLFDVVCKDRFGSIDNEEEAAMDEEESEKKESKAENSSDEDEDEEVEDPWAARTKEIKFAESDSPSKDGAQADGVEGGKVPETKMEVDDEEDDDDDWSEVLDRDRSAPQAVKSVPRDVAPIDPMEVGNPWDSAGAVASSPTHETSFDVAFNSPPPAAAPAAAAASKQKPFVKPALAAEENDDGQQSSNSDISEPGTEAKSSAGWADFSAFQPAAVPETSNTSENQSKLEDSSNQTSEVTANSTS